MCWKDRIDLAQKAAATLAYLVGAGWVLWNYWIGRTHKSWVQFRISSRRVTRGRLEYLVIKAELSNVGRSRVKLNPKREGVDVYAHNLPPNVEKPLSPRWVKPGPDSKPIATLPLFDWNDRPKYLEPNGLMIDELLLAVPKHSDRFLRIDGYVESGTVAWLSRAIVEPSTAAETPSERKQDSTVIPH